MAHNTVLALADAVRSARLASSEPDNTERMTAVGWGFTSDQSVAITARQRKVVLNLATDQEADDIYADDTIDYDHHMCVRTTGGVGPCSVRTLLISTILKTDCNHTTHE